MESSKVQFKCEVLLKMEILQIREMRNLKKKTYVFDVEFKKNNLSGFVTQRSCDFDLHLQTLTLYYGRSGSKRSVSHNWISYI